jgi:adenylate kinase
MKKDIVLFGIQGAGKGTQAKKLAEAKNMKIFETGAELRALTKQTSELANKVNAIISRGDLVPNEIVMEIVEEFVNNTPLDQPIIFDGLPRSLPQKETFDALLAKKGRRFSGIALTASKREVIERMKERGRSDDNEAAIEKRLQNYESETVPVINAYQAEGKLKSVNGMQSIDEVFADLVQVAEEMGSQGCGNCNCSCKG